MTKKDASVTISILMRLGWVVLFVLIPVFSWGSKLIVLKDGVRVYSGPSVNYRPIQTVGRGKKLYASSRLVQTPQGGFYKVLIIFKGGRKQVGFIRAQEKVQMVLSQDAEDVDKYSADALADSAIQAGYYGLKGSNFFWTIGYQKYPAPSFYYKIFGGQFLSKLASNLLIGGEIGTDHFISRRLSVYTAFSTGVFIAPQDGILFAGAKTANLFMQGGTGLRYNAKLAAVSFGLLQALALNQNDSFLSWGGGLTLEVGL